VHKFNQPKLVQIFCSVSIYANCCHTYLYKLLKCQKHWGRRQSYRAYIVFCSHFFQLQILSLVKFILQHCIGEELILVLKARNKIFQLLQWWKWRVSGKGKTKTWNLRHEIPTIHTLTSIVLYCNRLTVSCRKRERESEIL